MDLNISFSSIIDQQNTSGTIGIGFGDNGNGRNYMAQGFIPTANNINAIAFYLVGKSGNANQGYLVWIDNADANFFPTGTVLQGIGGVTEITNAQLVTGALTKYDLSETVTLTPGNRYVICFTPYNTSTNQVSLDYQDWRSSVSNPYASGRRVHADADFTNWSAPDSGNADILFRTYSSNNETIAVSESRKLELQSHISKSEAITITENTALLIPTLHLSTAETITITEASTMRLEAYQTLSDSITISEALQARLDAFYSVTDTIEVSEQIHQELQSHAAVTDEIAITENAALELSVLHHELAVSDSITLTEEIAAETHLQLQTQEILTISEAINKEIPVILTIQEDIEVTEAINSALSHQATTQEEITITEQVAHGVSIQVSLADTVTVTDSPALLIPTLHITKSEAITVSDSPNIFKELPYFFIAVEENITVQDVWAEGIYTHFPDPIGDWLMATDGRIARIIANKHGNVGIIQFIT